MSVARSSMLFSAGTLISRLSGVARESVLGAVFGASVYMDAFVVAFRIPNLLRELVAEGALGSSFTKVYSALCIEDQTAAQRLLIQTLQLVTLLSLCICTLGIFIATPLVNLVTDVSSQSTPFHTITINLTKLLFPFIGFAALGAVAQGALYQRGGFFLAAVAPILFNIGSIIGALWLGNASAALFPASTLESFGDASIFGLAVGTLMGGAAQAGIQICGLWRPLLREKKLWLREWPFSGDIKKVFVLMAPMVIAASAGQINVVVNTNFATSLGSGAVTWLYFAFRLLQLPIGMFGVAVGAAVLPALSRSITRAGGKVDAQVSIETMNALDLVTWLMIPCFLFLYGNATDVTRLLYEAGRFTADDTTATAIAIQAYSLGLWSYGLLKVLNSYYYAVGRTKFPMMVSLFNIGANYIGNLLLVKKFGHQGLAIMASISLSLNAVLLLLGMHRDRMKFNGRQTVRSLGLIVVGAVLVFLIRQVLHPLLFERSVASLVNLPAMFVTKIDSAARLTVDGIFVVVIFGSMGLIRIKKTPKQAFAMLRRRR